MQKIIIIGNLVRDPESGVTAKGTSYCSFTIAADRRYKVDGEKVTDYFRIKTWRQTADICAKYLSKGKKVCAIGELQASTYEAKDGTQRVSLDVNADEVEFLTPKDGPNAAPKEKPTTYEDGFTDISSDDIPF